MSTFTLSPLEKSLLLRLYTPGHQNCCCDACSAAHELLGEGG